MSEGLCRSREAYDGVPREQLLLHEKSEMAER